jgi:hypothetical protein
MSCYREYQLWWSIALGDYLDTGKEKPLTNQFRASRLLTVPRETHTQNHPIWNITCCSNRWTFFATGINECVTIRRWDVHTKRLFFRRPVFLSVVWCNNSSYLFTPCVPPIVLSIHLGPTIITKLTNVAIFWDITSRSSYVNRRFGEMHHLHLQAWQPTALWFLAWLIFDPENGEETFHRNSGSHTDFTALIPEDSNIHNYSCENLNSDNRAIFFFQKVNYSIWGTR